MIFFDTETCGLHGLPVLLQYAEDDGEIVLWNFWKAPVTESLQLLRYIIDQEVVGFNLAFDWFHISKMFNTLAKVSDKSCYPEDIIEEMADCELLSRDGYCIKPKSALDLMLHARKTSYQNTMERKDITIKRVPVVLATMLINELNKRLQLDDIFFARRKSAERWVIRETNSSDFVNIVLKFAASGSLKRIAEHALKIKTKRTFSDVELNKKLMPVEYGYAPFARLAGEGAWPEVIQFHIDHWEYNDEAREYAYDDVVYTRGLYEFFNKPEVGDDDSILACSVAACRLRGYAIDKEKLAGLRAKKIEEMAHVPVDPKRVREFIYPYLDDASVAAIVAQHGKETTKKVVLEGISEGTELCSSCEGLGCNDCLLSGEQPTEAAKRAQQVINKRTGLKEIELFDKLLFAGRFHASVKVIGALSGRMAGADGLNPQGIKKATEVRECFPLAFGDLVLCGGDFDAYEVCIAIAAFDDPDLEAEVRSGKAIHALFAEELFPNASYDDVVASKGSDFDMYTRGKQGVFSQIYGGNENTLQNRLGIDLETATKAAEGWRRRFKGVARYQKMIFDMFCSMRQPEGIGSRIFWHEPADSIASLNGFERRFTLENTICKTLFELAEKPPVSWTNLKMKCIRRDREQKVGGAIRSAIFGAAFSIQSQNMRAAMNHVIQSTGAIITKNLQRRLWDLQPCGVAKWLIQPLNIHDEIEAPTHPSLIEKSQQVVREAIEEYKAVVPLVAMTWKTNLENWAS